MKINREDIQRMIGRSAGGSGSSGGGGSSEGMPIMSLKSLSDTNIDDPQTGDVIVYNDTNGMWENKEKAPKAELADHVPWTGVTNPLRVGTSEFNFLDALPAQNIIYINHNNRAGEQLTSPIVGYSFSNGQRSRTGVTVRADNFFADSAVSVVSDQRKKDVTGGLRLDLDKIAAAPSVLFKWKDREDDTEHVGTIAQYWQDVLPQVVNEDTDGGLSMQYGVAALVSVISLAREVMELKEKLAEHGIR